MESEGMAQYLSSKKVVEALLRRGLISVSDFEKADDFLARKYCIKTCSIYRSNHLLLSEIRAIDSTAKKED